MPVVLAQMRMKAAGGGCRPRFLPVRITSREAISRRERCSVSRRRRAVASMSWSQTFTSMDSG
ncbi:hypothetical protein A6A28_24500 [Streptomyces sp. CB03578]|nr:hypothetical protein A6A28_24500 [Streptomyces sp. CB03578]